MELENEIAILKAENEKQKQIINELETRLKKYTNNQSHRKYLEQHKEEIKNIKKRELFIYF